MNTLSKHQDTHPYRSDFTMSRPHVGALEAFYDSPPGRRAAAALRRAIDALWPPVAKDTVLGIGYASPYLDGYPYEKALTLACMPSGQGAMAWPPGRPGRASLVDETALPIPDNTANRVLLIHALEHTGQARATLEEVWRVLTPGGRVLAVVPNRYGWRAPKLAGPFSQGRPYGAAQLASLFAECRFAPGRTRFALYAWPSPAWLHLKLAEISETLGSLVFPGLSGVVLMEAEKQVYARISEPASARSRPRPAFIPAAQPAMGRERM